MGLLRAKYNKERDYDQMLSGFIQKHVLPVCKDRDDDILVLCMGKTGSGKSMLMLHAYEEYAGDQADIKYISFNRTNLADNLQYVSSLPKGVRFNGYDEANVSKRDALTKFNKALLDVYYSIRGLNVFHWWNNPSIDIIDKPFIKDRVTGMFMITTHYMDRPRTYYYFDKKSLLMVLKKYNNLDYETLYKVRGKYAYYKGWFKDYNGFLKKPYLDKKNPRMEEKLKEFKSMFGSNTDTTTGDRLYTVQEVARLTEYTTQHISRLRQKGFFDEIDYNIKSQNNVLYKPSALKKLYDRKVKVHPSVKAHLDPVFVAMMEALN